MKTVVEINKCPNCGGKLERTEKENILRCPSCDSEFEAAEMESEEESSETEKKSKKVDPDSAFTKTAWFDYRVEYKKLLKGPDSREAMNTFVHCINDLGTSEEILKYIKKELSGISGLCWEKHKEDKMNAFINKAIKGQISADDKVLLYANSGIFSSGKHGFVVTDKKIVFSAKKPETVWFSDLQKIGFETEDDFVFVHLNGQDKTKLGVIDGGSDKPHGVITALICALAFENDPGRDKIILYEVTDEDEDDEE